MRPYSKDLRLRVLAAVDAGKPRQEVAKTFSVSMPTIKRWLKRRRESRDVEPEPIPGRPARKGAMLKEWLPKHLEANDDLTLEEHREASVSGSERQSLPPPLGGPSPVCPMAAGRSKKEPTSQRARRGGEGLVAVAGFSLRGQAPRVRGRVGLSHLHDAP